MDFTLTEDDAQHLRHIASLEPLEARAYLQDRPDLARRVAGWPPEIRLESIRGLTRCTGQTLGGDPAAWAAWWEKNPQRELSAAR